MNRHPLRRLLLVTSCLVAAAAGCSGKIVVDATNNPADGGAKRTDAATSTHAAADASDDARADVPNLPPPVDAGPSDTGPNDALCWKNLDPDSCSDCCINNHTGGYQFYLSSALSCLCTAQVCGAACSKTLCAPTPQNADAICDDCINENYADTCGMQVADDCSVDKSCTEMMGCVQGCQ